ncbi:hypothetical protein JTB14_011411 [Gonioctena quinquepunctata]|nr:hypothetical protein JTB14_011411 [Gonioctena quinquepunctata]
MDDVDVDDGSLIELVSRFSVLYDKNNPRYKIKSIKDDAWQKISIILQCPAKICEQRWCVLRNKYARLKRKLRTTPSELGTLTITWPCYEPMKFLDPFVKGRRSRMVGHVILPKESKEEIMEMTFSEESNSESELQESGYAVETILGEVKNNEVDTPQKITVIPVQPILTQSKLSQDSNNDSGFFSNNSKIIDPLLTHDDDHNFVKSLVSDMSIFSKEERILLKRRIYNVIADFLEEKLKKRKN